MILYSLLVIIDLIQSANCLLLYTVNSNLKKLLTTMQNMNKFLKWALYFKMNPRKLIMNKKKDL